MFTVIHIWGAYSNPVHTNQLWAYDAGNKQIKSLYNQMCLAAISAILGMNIVIIKCNPNDPLQQFVYNAGTYQFSFPAVPNACIDAGSPFPNCTMAPYNSYPYCNVSLGPDERAADLAGRLQGGDVAGLLYDQGVGVPRLGIPHVQFNEGVLELDITVASP
jgi:hypothetical protein